MLIKWAKFTHTVCDAIWIEENEQIISYGCQIRGWEKNTVYLIRTRTICTWNITAICCGYLCASPGNQPNAKRSKNERKKFYLYANHQRNEHKWKRQFLVFFFCSLSSHRYKNIHRNANALYAYDVISGNEESVVFILTQKKHLSNANDEKTHE